MSEEKQGICKDFARGKNCRFGRHCRYLHLRNPIHYYTEKSSNHETVKQPSHKYPAGTRISTEYYTQSYGYPNHAYVKKSYSTRCKYFDAGRCFKGDACLLKHEKCEDVSLTQCELPEETKLTTVQCEYFKRGYCRYGETCRFLHVQEEATATGSLESREDKATQADLDNDDTSTKEETSLKLHENKTSQHSSDNKKSSKKETRVYTRKKTGETFVASFTPKLIYGKEDADDKLCSSLKEKEIGYIKRRYPKARAANEGDIIIDFQPSDADWPYDVKKLTLQLIFSERYPVEPLTVKTLENEQLPETLERYLWKSIEEWIQERFHSFSKQAKVELVARALFHWLDHSLEGLFTEGLKAYQKELIAKASGIQFIPATQLRDEFAHKVTENEDGQKSESDASEDYECGKSDAEPLPANPNHAISLEAAKHGTEVKLINLHLLDKAASLVAERLTIIVHCSRCKHPTEVTTPYARINVFCCSKCGAEQLVTFRVNMAHQYTSIIGYIDVQDCAVHDVILATSNFKVGCLECSRDMSFGGIMPGGVRLSWCHTCNSKLSVCADAVKCLALQQVELDVKDVHQLAIKKTKKLPKDPAIKEGQPLPENGACKHYKKSFRWLRFPCCGKAFPCDVCHDSSEDHGFVFANRMICGYCCYEQPYAVDKPCKSCDSSMTKRSSSHWEGGKGCRDQVKMARNDEAKFKNMSKTVSRKQQNKTVSGKKTKLRHA